MPCSRYNEFALNIITDHFDLRSTMAIYYGLCRVSVWFVYGLYQLFIPSFCVCVVLASLGFSEHSEQKLMVDGMIASKEPILVSLLAL